VAGSLALAAVLGIASTSSAQLTGVENGEWRYLGGDAGHTRSSQLTQINAANFAKLKVAWIFRGDNFGPGLEFNGPRHAAVLVKGVLYTVVGQRRQVVAIDAATGETRWTFREPDTSRYLRSPRSRLRQRRRLRRGRRSRRDLHFDPRFFPLGVRCQNRAAARELGRPYRAAERLPQVRVIDMIPDLVRDWGPWLTWRGERYDPDYGLPRKLGEITCSSPRSCERRRRRAGRL